MKARLAQTTLAALNSSRVISAYLAYLAYCGLLGLMGLVGMIMHYCKLLGTCGHSHWSGVSLALGVVAASVAQSRV